MINSYKIHPSANTEYLQRLINLAIVEFPFYKFKLAIRLHTLKKKKTYTKV